MKTILLTLALILGLGMSASAAPFPKSRNYMSVCGYDRYKDFLKTGVWQKACGTHRKAR